MSRDSETQECGNCGQQFAFSDECHDRIVDIDDLYELVGTYKAFHALHWSADGAPLIARLNAVLKVRDETDE